jgi:hypothetical protein
MAEEATAQAQAAATSCGAQAAAAVPEARADRRRQADQAWQQALLYKGPHRWAGARPYRQVEQPCRAQQQQTRARQWVGGSGHRPSSRQGADCWPEPVHHAARFMRHHRMHVSANPPGRLAAGLTPRELPHRRAAGLRTCAQTGAALGLLRHGGKVRGHSTAAPSRERCQLSR